MFKKIILVFLVCIFLFGYRDIHVSVFGQTGRDPLTLPPLTSLVTDYSNVFSAETLSGLNIQALAIKQLTTAQIASVLFPNRNGHELFDIGMRLFRESGIGSTEKNNGLLLLIATEEKKLRIIVGYGLEGVFPDIRVRDLIESRLRPYINKEERSLALEAYHLAVRTRLEEVGATSTFGISSSKNELTSRDIRFFLLWCFATVESFRWLNSKKTTLTSQLSPLLPFGGLFLLILRGLPGIVGAFFGYFSGIIWGLLTYPKVGGNKNNFTPRGGGGWSSGGFGGGGFSGFGGGSSGGGGAGD